MKDNAMKMILQNCANVCHSVFECSYFLNFPLVDDRVWPKHVDFVLRLLFLYDLL